MGSKTVTSPAGEPIQITSDDDWVEAVGATPQALRQWAGGMKPLVLRALWEHGEFTNKSGQVGREVHNWVTEHFPDADITPEPANVMALFRTPVNYPAVISKVNGKRTFSLKLVAMPETWHRKLMDDIGPGKPSSNGHGAPEAPQAPVEASWTEADWQEVQLDAPTVYEEPPPLEIHIAHQVAMSMLTAVVEIITAGTADTSKLAGSQRLQQDMQQVQELLSQRLQENQKLRNQLREAGDTISALKMERDGLRTRLRMTEHNLTEALKGETAQAVNSEIMKRVDQIMRTTPAAKGD